MLLDSQSLRSNTPSGFLVIDGVNGAGKSTLILKIKEYLIKQGKEVVTTREPGATTLGKQLRSLLLENEQEKICHKAETFLFAADRAEHVQKTIKPALAAGKIVISDRYYYSTVAFQGYGRGLDIKELQIINQLAIEEVLPDLVILLDLQPEEGLKRTIKRSSTGDTSKDSFENEDLSFHSRIREGFLEIARNAKEPFFVINARQTEEEVFQQARSLIDNLYLSK